MAQITQLFKRVATARTTLPLTWHEPGLSRSIGSIEKRDPSIGSQQCMGSFLVLMVDIQIGWIPTSALYGHGVCGLLNASALEMDAKNASRHTLHGQDVLNHLPSACVFDHQSFASQSAQKPRPVATCVPNRQRLFCIGFTLHLDKHSLLYNWIRAAPNAILSHCGLCRSPCPGVLSRREDSTRVPNT